MSGNLAHALKLQQAHDLLGANKPEQALPILQRLAQKAPADPDVNMLMGMVTLRMGRFEQAEYFCRKGVLGLGATPANFTNLALVLLAAGKSGEAMEWIDKALALDPSYNEARLTRANLLLDQRRMSEMLRTCEEALTYAWHPEVCVSYASAMAGLGETDKAVEFLREAVRRFPNHAPLRGLLAMTMIGQWGARPQEISAAHREFGALVDRIRPPYKHAYQPRKDPEKRLRVGLVSPDLRRHSVAYFIEPLLEHADREQVEIVCYSTNRTFDAVSARLKEKAALWRDVSGKIEVQIGAQMSEDRIDIALDLAGHTDGNSLLAFALRIAPVQGTYCGYPDTTGVNQMDWRIVDSHTDPDTPDVNARAVERLYRLDPCFLCYRPPEDAPAPQARPADAPVVFGSFNATRKHNAQTAALWCRVLERVPGSRLVLKSQDLVEQDVRAMVRARFGAMGDRVDFLDPPASLADHLALYAGIDVGLDPFPYHGTTTTCEALWMGVPEVTLAGWMHAGRVGVSLLNAVGVPELIARDADEYVEVAASLARDRARLGQYRSSLRDRMIASPLLDRRGFAQRMQEAFRAMWRDYCAR